MAGWMLWLARDLWNTINSKYNMQCGNKVSQLNFGCLDKNIIEHVCFVMLKFRKYVICWHVDMQLNLHCLRPVWWECVCVIKRERCSRPGGGWCCFLESTAGPAAQQSTAAQTQSWLQHSSCHPSCFRTPYMPTSTQPPFKPFLVL